jgi:uncharacterized protein DUF4365
LIGREHAMSESDFSMKLPKADRNSELQQLSINALNTLLPIDKFVFREELKNDAGVDGSVELKINSLSTNLRAQVQLKSTDSEETNKDGSISVQVAVANINYLLNGQSPIYILFIAPLNELRFVWALDEFRRQDELNPNWREQDSITIRFSNILNAEAIEAIHARIQREARLQRKIADTLSRVSSTDSVIVGINPKTLDITDPVKALEVLHSSGTLIVSSGYPEQVNNLARILSLDDARLPRILLVRAYAEFSLGRYHSAYALLSEALSHGDELSGDDQQFLAFLRAGCDYQAGRISLNELAAYINSIEQNQTGSFAFSHRINQLRYKLFLNRDRDTSSNDKPLAEFRALVTDIHKTPNASSAVKLHARLALIEAEGIQLNRSAFIKLAEAQVKAGLGRSNNYKEIESGYIQQFATFESQINSLVKDIKSVGNPLLLADSLLVRATAHFNYLTNQRSLSRINNAPIKIDEAGARILMSDIDEAIRIYSQARQLEGELRAKIIKADYLELIEKQEEAKEIAREVLPKAQALNFAVIVSTAEEHIAGQGLQSKLDFTHRDKTEEEALSSTASKSDEELLLDAAQLLRILELPTARLPVVEREFFSIRDNAKERLSWCRHLNVIQDLSHTNHPSTIYRTDPDRACQCNLHQYQSLIPSPDWKIVITGFKKTYCEQCPDRNPFQSPQDSSE